MASAILVLVVLLADQFSAGYVTVFPAQRVRLADGRAPSTLAEVVSDVWLERIRHRLGHFPDDYRAVRLRIRHHRVTRFRDDQLYGLPQTTLTLYIIRGTEGPRWRWNCCP